MNEQSLALLKHLLATPGPSGDEKKVAHNWRKQTRTFADQVYTDVCGNSFALLEQEGPRIMIAGHIDEIGLMISYIDSDGFLYFDRLGGWDPQVLIGQRVRLLGNQNEIIGVIGKKPIHLMTSDQRGNASKIKDLWIDIGVTSRQEAQEHISIGCVGVIDVPLYELPNQRIVSRSLDNRIGAFIVLEVLRLLAQNRPAATIAAVATTQEETSLAGATTAAFRFDPHIALIVDVTFATDHPDTSKKEDGDVRLGQGPVLSRGSANSPLIYRRLLDLATRDQIPYNLQITPRYTGTDADIIHITRRGVATGIVSIPCRYLHTPNEMIMLSDIDYAIQLIVAFIHSVQSETDFLYHE